MNLLVIDATAIIISAITGVVSLGTVAMTLLINKSVNKYKKEVDGKMSQLLEAKKTEGIIAGVAKQKDESASTASETVQAIIESPDISVTKNKNL